MSQTLLLADDSVTIQRVIELTFEDEDIQVIAVGDGQQAIERIESDPPDIVLADTGMPKRDGYDVALFIKEDPALSHIPVVLLTGAFEPVDEDRARQVGCDAVLVKPFEPQVVISRVRDLLDRRKTLAMPAPSQPAGVVAAPIADASPGEDAPTRQAPTGALSAHDSDEAETIVLPAQPVSTAGAKATAPSGTEHLEVGADDPLGVYLDQMDEAFDRLASGEGAPETPARSAPEPQGPAPTVTSDSATNIESLEGALSALEGALDKLNLDTLETPESPDRPDSSDERSGDATDGLTAPPATPVAPEDPAHTAHQATIEENEAAPTPPAPAVAASERVASAPLVSVSPVASTQDVTDPSPKADVPATEVSPPAAIADARVADRSQTTGTSLPGTTPPSLADAFASLLAAEQGDASRAQTVYPWPGAASSPRMSEDLIDQVTERVIARLSDGANSELMSQVVARVAEKLVREEIDRIKKDS
jgi:CheY-like chemotaxis protein